MSAQRFMNPESVAAIVVAAGSGSRLGDSSLGGPGPKALRQVAGISLLRRSVDQLISGGVASVVVVRQPDHRAAMAQALEGVSVPVAWADGGATRQDSVGKGLAVFSGGHMPEPSIVLVHDAARPLVPTKVIADVISAVRNGSDVVVPVIPVTDSVRAISINSQAENESNNAQLNGDSNVSHLSVEVVESKVVDRNILRAIQTPQGFRTSILIRSHKVAKSDGFTDDAAVCEAAGYQVDFVSGSDLSMKITRPHDFLLAEALLAEKSCVVSEGDNA